MVLAIDTNKMNIAKPDLTRIKDIVRKPIVGKILRGAYMAVLCYAVIFILSEILVSGGKSEHNPYFIAVIAIFLIASQILFIPKKVYSDTAQTIISALSVTLTIAILDYLIVNLALEKNSLELYKYWPYYFIYLTTLALPFIRSNWSAKELRKP